jgi:ribosomal protein S7
MFYYSILNLRPLISLKPVKVGSVVFKVPAPASDHRRRLYAIKFIIMSARDTRGLISLDRVLSLLQSVYFATKNSASERKFLLYKEALDNRLFIRKLK